MKKCYNLGIWLLLEYMYLWDGDYIQVISERLEERQPFELNDCI